MKNITIKEVWLFIIDNPANLALFIGTWISFTPIMFLISGFHAGMVALVGCPASYWLGATTRLLYLKNKGNQ